jgi:hypothetical protein
MKPQHIIQFQEYINESTGKIAKVLKPTKDIESKFENELAENRRVIKIFNDQAEKYLIISALPPFQGKDVIGCIVYLYVGEPIYVCFSTKCENNFTPDLDKLIADILESIEILQIISYKHNDIKLDNIVKCGDTYKLIDWEQTYPKIMPKNVWVNLAFCIDDDFRGVTIYVAGKKVARSRDEKINGNDFKERVYNQINIGHINWDCNPPINSPLIKTMDLNSSFKKENCY